MNLFSNMSADDVLRYTDLPESVLFVVQTLQDRITNLEKALEIEEKYCEHMQGRAENAHTLLEEIQNILDSNTRLTDVKKAVSLAFENSYVEM